MSLKLSPEQIEKLFGLIDRKLFSDEEIEWQDIIDELNLDIHRDTLRKATFLYPLIKEYYEKKVEEGMSDEQLDKLTIKKLELQKERNKLSAEKNEINKWIREQARTENVLEKIEQSIENLHPIRIPQIQIKAENNKKTAIIDLADSHFGREGKIYGLRGELLAEYSVDIFKRRMWELLEKTIKIIEKEELSHVTVLNLSDSIDGLIHMNQLLVLQLGVVDQTMQYAEFLSEWLNELSRYVTIDYRSVLGNHSENRNLNTSRGELPKENMERIISWYLKTRLASNSRIKVFEAENLVYFNVFDTWILATHGQDEKNLIQSIKDYTMIYQVPIHILKTGHLHHLSNTTVGMNGIQNIEYIQSPAICGVDGYSMKLKKVSNAGTLITVFEEGYGKLCTYDIRLK